VSTAIAPGTRTFTRLHGRICVPGAVLAVGASTVLLRLPYVAAPLSSDEGGFLVLARQWHEAGPGGSLYGSFWVDRPPLLVATFQLADALGGRTPLRLIGAVAAAVTVVAVGLTVHRVCGPRPAVWASAVACGLLVSPGVGGVNVDGELLAAPYVAVGIAATVVALTTPALSRARWASAAAGACAVAAVLVKQNMLDVFVFSAAFGFLTWRSGHVVFTRLRRLTAPWLVGAAASLFSVLGFAALHGTTPGEVFFAMYPFRVRAAQVIAVRMDGAYAERLTRLVESGLLSGGPLVIAALLVLLALRRTTPGHPLARPFAGAVVVLAGYVVVSMALGGNWWLHYLVQLAVPTSLAAGLVVASVPRPGVRLVALVAGVGALGWASGLVARTDASGQDIGRAIAKVEAPGDTIVSALGDGDVVAASGLDSPYPYLWSLPSRVLDPRMSALAGTLDGTHAPTWLVVRGHRTYEELANHATGAALRTRYRPVSEVCGRTVFLRSDAVRRAPEGPPSCRAPFADWSRDLVTASGRP
jgi:hypothetical protein